MKKGLPFTSFLPSCASSFSPTCSPFLPSSCLLSSLPPSRPRSSPVQPNHTPLTADLPRHRQRARGHQLCRHVLHLLCLLQGLPGDFPPHAAQSQGELHGRLVLWLRVRPERGHPAPLGTRPPPQPQLPPPSAPHPPGEPSSLAQHHHHHRHHHCHGRAGPGGCMTAVVAVRGRGKVCGGEGGDVNG